MVRLFTGERLVTAADMVRLFTVERLVTAAGMVGLYTVITMIEGALVWILVVLALVLGVYVSRIYDQEYFSKLHIPHVKPLPLFGNMCPVFFRKANLAEHIQEICQLFAGSKMIGFFEFDIPLIMLKDPDIIKQITVKDFDHFMDHRLPVSESADPIFAKNLFSLRGDRWKNMRSTLSPAFTSSKMKTMFVLIEEIGKQLADHLAERCRGDGTVELDMKDFYTRFTNDVIATVAFGIHCDTLKNPDNEFYTMGKDAAKFDEMGMFLFLHSRLFRFLLRLIGTTIFSKPSSRFFRSLIHGTLATREEQGIIRPDLIHLMMQARKGTLKSDVSERVKQTLDSKKASMALTPEDITAQAMFFFLAGFDTTATVLSFTSLMMATHPDIQKRVQDEVDAMLQENDGNMTYDGIHGMKYLDMVISETLRLYPPALTLDRKCVRPYVIAATDTTPSIRINVGEGVLIPIFSIHRDPDFFPEPDRFDPERFNEKNKPNIKPFTYMPFGSGPRNCIGMRMAQMEFKIALTSILSRFSFEVIDKTPTKIRLQKKSFPMTPIGGFWVGIKPRTDLSV